MQTPKHTLPTIVISQFLCTSLWFASNAVLPNLITTFGLTQTALGTITSFVQFGFITGTLVFASLSIADRFSPSKVFMICALLGSLSNLTLIWNGNSYLSILFFRFLTGFFLAGIYPVGMKIAADYYDKGLGKSLGFLVGALVLGTALPHLLKNITSQLPWESVMMTTSALAVFGGTLMFILVPDGPYRKPGQKIKLNAVFSVFKVRKFRTAAFGYFGHMWELYTFWAFVPVLLNMYIDAHPSSTFNTPLLSFFIIGSGSLSCIGAGYLSLRYGSKKVATLALLGSGICCLLFPFLLEWNVSEGFVLFLLIWGLLVIADSPLFSTLVAQNAPPELKGTALTIVNCIGFALTIVSIQTLIYLQSFNSKWVFLILFIGPLFGLINLKRRKTVH